MFRRLLILFDASADPEQVLTAARRLAPAPDSVHLYGLSPERRDLEAPRPPSLNALDRFWEAAKDWHVGTGIGHQLEDHLDVDALTLSARQHHSELVVIGPLLGTSPHARARVILSLAIRERLHVLSVGAHCPTVPSPTSRITLAVAPDGRGLGSVVDLITKRGLPRTELIALTSTEAPGRADQLHALSRALGVSETLRMESLAQSVLGRAEAFESAARRCGADLLLAPADAVDDMEALMLGLFGARALQDAHVPTLLLPRTLPTSPLFEERHAVSDSLLLPGLEPRFAIERVGLLLNVSVPEPGVLTVFEGGSPLGSSQHQGGTATLPASWFSHVRSGHLPALAFTCDSAPGEPIPCHLLAPERPLLLVDSRLALEPLGDVLARMSGTSHPVFVRLRDSEPLDTCRERLRKQLPGLMPPLLVDASAWLDDLRADDVPRQVDAQRLLRVAVRLAMAGAAISAVITRDEHKPVHPFIRTLTESELLLLSEGDAPAPLLLPEAPDTISRELALAGGGQCAGGHAIDFEFDNAAARESAIAAIDAARSTVHWQCYIVEDDTVTARFAEALQRAAGRGVHVRLLADALYSGHETFGVMNPVLVKLSKTPNIEVRAIAPLSGLPSLSALKQRNHRKMLLVDTEQAFITGRNMGAPYYTGFNEVALRRTSHYRDVPWLDCGARLSGPLVSDLERAFLAEWTRAGGAPYPVPVAAPAGEMSARLVLHEGLEDTHTLDTQLALIRHAKSRLVLVNTFPLLLELQNALVAALRRGVRVEVLFGSVRPHYGHQDHFAGGTFREVADRYVRSRLDAVIDAGGIAYEFAMPPAPAWEPELERVFPHVHAKLLVQDTATVAVGSANLDVTAAYWESEALLVVHDAPFAERMLAALEPLLATSRRIDREDTRWRTEAEQRAWVGRNWPSLVG
ncbi:phosphatidylserine/phosphatidylglycerophosphate/cardiolipin synthase family protein [Pyxidicoccus fallax]|uniref:Phosphatidylserine/phosphatidylglycerophosphate/ cardiolipin synthase family protein n=1 Tax=Pyxidicoccus fallax TaxID=394095 RepID=A0A848LE37_9BACT|nr:phosphatidylserine/phosphatidylglycerophosphate/cardiolipin synthase family protein [Pyxidicoccus fallax]NMO13708.1 phosphatidylserine/phosphatidylglycerophosphate/cardiolipin synthase family protein [Pyxidicoccus fallax]NPC86084.1 phosphatidylserine/phosphatidylglycerophosphate/cardiolipin synthase family protein [Pyxidicoccus fallax]